MAPSAQAHGDMLLNQRLTKCPAIFNDYLISAIMTIVSSITTNRAADRERKISSWYREVFI